MDINQLKESEIEKIYRYIKLKWNFSKVYIGVDVGKMTLDVGITISNTNIQTYLGSVDNTAQGFRQIESFVIGLIELGLDEHNLFFATENTGTYGHDITNFFEDRIPNVYILNSTLTCSARQFYSKANFKNDEIDSIIIATTLRDLDNKGALESETNHFRTNMGIAFVRRSFNKETDSLRMLFRRLASLREEKSKVMTAINLYKERLFPEISNIFKIKSRSSSQSILIENFTRKEILQMGKDEFIQKYKSITSKGQHTQKIMEKVLDFYDKVQERGHKKSHSEIDTITCHTSDDFILDIIKFKNKRYNLIIQEMKYIKESIGMILDKLRKNGYFIPSFKGIDDDEIGIFLGELGSQIYNIHISSLKGFIGWYPNNYTSGGGHMVKASQFSDKKSIIKKFLYVRMYGFLLHNPSFRLYKKLLLQYYGTDTELDGIVKLKNKRKVEAKCGGKLLEIIHNCYKYSCNFDDNRFINGTIIPLIENMKKNGLSMDVIDKIIIDIYGKKVPDSLG